MKTELKNEEYFHALVNSVADYALCHLDDEGCVVSWNPGAEWISGFTALEIVGRHFSSFYPAEAAASGHPAEALAQALVQGRFQSETELLRKDGTQFWADILLAPLLNVSESLRGFALVMRDVSARKNLEAERERTIQDLRDTLNNVKILSGNMTLCVSCKKICDPAGQWHPLELYLREHSEVILNHEVCHGCAQHIHSSSPKPLSVEE